MPSSSPTPRRSAIPPWPPGRGLNLGGSLAPVSHTSSKALSYLLANIEAEDETGNQRRAADFFDEQKLHDPMIRAGVTKVVQHPADGILFTIHRIGVTSDLDVPLFL